MAPWRENGRYLSRLWSDFKNFFVWWKLVKIVIYFYSISDFLSFTVWPLDVSEVTKVSHVNFFKQKIQNFQFLATNMLYTSNESWNYVEFKFITKNRMWLWKIRKNPFFSFLPQKRGWPKIFAIRFHKISPNKSQKWLYQGLVEA